MTSFKRACPLLAGLALASASAQAIPVLGTELGTFAVLGGAAVTNTGPSVLLGSLGVSDNASPTGITGFFGTLANEGPGTLTGTVHQGDATALLAGAQLDIAKTSLSLMGPGTLLSADLVGLTLGPGVYTVPAGTSNLTGTLTLDGMGNANAFWVFQMPSTLITSTGAVVNVINTGSGAGVYWNVGSSATLNTSTTFEGNILASASISMGDGVSLSCGRALARAGSVTLINDRVDAGDCVGTGAQGSQGLSGGLTIPIPASGAGTGEVIDVPAAIPLPVTPIPEPEAWALMLAGLGAVFVLRRRATRSSAHRPVGHPCGDDSSAASVPMRS